MTKHELAINRTWQEGRKAGESDEAKGLTNDSHSSDYRLLSGTMEQVAAYQAGYHNETRSFSPKLASDMRRVEAMRLLHRISARLPNDDRFSQAFSLIFKLHTAVFHDVPADY